MIRFTKQQLVNSVLAEARDLNAYLNAGGLPAQEKADMDAEFYAEFAQPIWDDINYQIEWLQKAPSQYRNKWAFEHDLNAEQMRWLEHYASQMTVEKVKDYLSQKFGTTDLNALLYREAKRRKLDNDDSLIKFTDDIMASAVPHL